MKLLDVTLPSPAGNLACDEALLDRAEIVGGEGMLRFWESPHHFAVVGYANQVATEVNVPACDEKGVPILRRCSGGGTVLQGPGCLNYTLILPITEDGPCRSINSANRFIMERNRAALAGLLKQPVAVCGHTDLALGLLKFSGNSQRRRKQYLLFHGTFLLDFDLTLIGELLSMPSKQPEYRAARSHETFLTNINVPAHAVKTALAQAWGATMADEVPADLIARLVEEKYSRREWNFKFDAPTAA